MILLLLRDAVLLRCIVYKMGSSLGFPRAIIDFQGISLVVSSLV